MTKIGRPSKYTPALWSELIDRISAGEPLQQICRDEHMPSAGAVYDWTDERAECRPEGIPATLTTDFARARLKGHDAIAAECLQIANTTEEGEEVTIKADGSRETKRGDMLGHRKLKIETRLKLLAKWDKRYGDKVAVTGEGGGPIIFTATPLDEKL